MAIGRSRAHSRDDLADYEAWWATAARTGGTVDTARGETPCPLPVVGDAVTASDERRRWRWRQAAPAAVGVPGAVAVAGGERRPADRAVALLVGHPLRRGGVGAGHGFTARAWSAVRAWWLSSPKEWRAAEASSSWSSVGAGDGRGGSVLRRFERRPDRLQRAGNWPAAGVRAAVDGPSGDAGGDRGARRFCATLAERHTVVLYDRWGCGLSDRAREDLSHDADVQVLADLVAHLGLRRVALYGPSTGGQVALSYADRYPRNVSHLVLFGMSVVSLSGGPTWMALRDLMLADWAVGAQAIAAVLLAGAEQDEQDRFARLMQAGTTAQMAVALLAAAEGRDVGPLADRVRVSTLVASRRGDRLAPPEASRRLAARIPRAELVLLDGDAHVHYLGDVDAFAAVVLAFLGRRRGSIDPAAGQGGPVRMLTSRECEVLDPVAAGLTNAVIAERLVLSVRTVERHTLNIYSKLGVRSRAEAVAVAYRRADQRDGST